MYQQIGVSKPFQSERLVKNNCIQEAVLIFDKGKNKISKYLPWQKIHILNLFKNLNIYPYG
jgi:hypothetical protein